MRYLRAGSIEEAIELSAVDGAALLAGGTDLITMRANGFDFQTAVDIKHVAQLAEFLRGESETRIGATVTMRDLVAACREVPHLTALADGACVVGAPQTRLRATLGGNVCRASPAGDTLAALLALGARAEVRDAHGTDTVPFEQFITGPGRTVLEQGQLATTFVVPDDLTASAYERFTYRDSLDLAVVGVAVAVRSDGGACTDARVALSGVAPTPILAEPAARFLLGNPDPDALVSAGSTAALACSPIDDVRGTAAFRRRAVATLVVRVARRALAASGVEI